MPNASSPSPLDLYEIAVTSPDQLAGFILALHGHNPKTLAEDFSGTAALSRAWIRLDPKHRAVAIDLDQPTLDHIRSNPRLKKRAIDVLHAGDKADVVAATNFPVGYWHTRPELIRYLRQVRKRLNKGGIFVADLYGGPHAYTLGRRSKRFDLGRGRTLHYIWHQKSVDGLTNRVFNAIHFRITGPTKASRPIVFNNAFTYDWRLWSIPELRDALDEAGFKSTEVHDRMGAAIDHEGNVHVQAVSDGELDRDWVVYVVGRT
jgi:hypothetical protein